LGRLFGIFSQFAIVVAFLLIVRTLLPPEN
jgi:hypothetical protein